MGFLKTLTQSIFGNLELLAQILLSRGIEKIFANKLADQQKLKTHDGNENFDFFECYSVHEESL